MKEDHGAVATSAAGWILRCTLAALLVGGLTHIATVLYLARDDATGAYATLAALGHGPPLRTFAGPAVGDTALPYRDPAMAEAFCLFDLAAGPVAVALPVTQLDLATLTVHDQHGQAVYALTNRSAVGGVLTLSIMTTAMAAEAEESDEGGLHVPFAGRRGFVAVRVLAASPSERPTAEAMAAGLTCRTAP